MSKLAKPINLHLVQGNKSKMSKADIEQRQKAEEKLQFESDKIKPPTWLNNEEKKLFRKLVKEFETTGILVNVDVNSLALYVNALRYYIEAKKIIDEEGMMIEHTNKGNETNRIPHPMFTKQKQFYDQMEKIASQFGLSPTARTKLSLSLMNGQDEQHPDDEGNRFSDRV